MPSVAKNTFYLTMALVGQKILAFVYFTLLARFLGAEAIGKYSFALAFTTIFSIIADFGLTNVLIREIARNKEKANEFLGTFLIIKIILALLAYFIAITVAFFFYYQPLTIQLISLSGLVMFLDSFHLCFYGILRGLHNLKFEAVGMVVSQLITLIFGVLALGAHLSLHFFILSLAFGSLWNVIFSFFIIKKQGLSFHLHFQKEIARLLFFYTLPFALSGIFTKIYAYIDTVILQALKGDIVVGWYSVAYKITYAFQFLPLALSAALYPALSSTWKENKTLANWIYDRALIYCLLTSFPLAIGIFILAPEIIPFLFGNEFRNSIVPLQISILGLISIFLYFPIGALLNATDHQVINTKLIGLTMIFNIVLNILFIPSLGAIGSSIAALSANTFLFLTALFSSKKILSPSPLVKINFFKISFASVVMAIIIFLAKTFIFWPLAVMIGGFIYLLLIFLLKVISKKDWQKFIHFFKFKQQPGSIQEI
jgi:O-antigen/teichoic acid export membrane protein